VTLLLITFFYGRVFLSDTTAKVSRYVMQSPNSPLHDFCNLPSKLDAIKDQVREYQA